MIILTGASGGIGRELIGYLLKIDDVIGIYNRSLPSDTSDMRLKYEKIDIEKSDEIRLFAKEWGPKLSKVTLVHAAAVKIDGLVINYTEADWDHVMGVNIKGNFLFTRAFLPFMIGEKWGRIIHISSLGGIQGCPGTLAYSASKASLVGMSNVLAKEYARFHITSNVLVLGYFEAGLFNALRDSEKKRVIEQIPSKVLGNVSNIANAVEFLIKSEYTNGSVINIDGGV